MANIIIARQGKNMAHLVISMMLRRINSLKLTEVPIFDAWLQPRMIRVCSEVIATKSFALNRRAHEARDENIGAKCGKGCYLDFRAVAPPRFRGRRVRVAVAVAGPAFAQENIERAIQRNESAMENPASQFAPI